MERDLSVWKGVERPHSKIMEGRFARLEPLDPHIHADELYDLSTDELTRNMKRDRGTRQEYQQWLEDLANSEDCVHFAVIDKATGKIGGRQMLCKINTEDGVVEISGVLRGPSLARKPASTEAVYLLLTHIFDELGYRRFEWRCFDSNEESKRAAERMGFTLEGVLRRHHVVKGISRNTAVYSILDCEWPALKCAFEKWLHPDNFDASGTQKKNLQAFQS